VPLGEADPAPSPGDSNGTTPRKQSEPKQSTEQETTEEEPTWCDKQGTHAFCADFDSYDVGEGWDITVWGLPPGGIPGQKFEAVASDRSTPNALSITEPPIAVGEKRGGTEFSREVSATNPKSVRVALALRIDSVGVDNDTHAMVPVYLGLWKREGTMTNYLASTYLGLRSTTTELLASVVEQEDFDLTVDIEEFPRERWVDVELSMDLTASPPLATIRYDGKLAGEKSLAGLDVAEIEGASLKIGMTLSPTPHAAPFVALFDNVLVDVVE
jgi:hypothetical protein